MANTATNERDMRETVVVTDKGHEHEANSSTGFVVLIIVLVLFLLLLLSGAFRKAGANNSDTGGETNVQVETPAPTQNSP